MIVQKRGSLEDMNKTQTDLNDFYRSFIDLTDRILPTLTTAEQLVYLQMFSRSIGHGQKTCRLSYRDLAELTGQAIQTIKTAIEGLIKRGYLEIETQAGPRSARTYRIKVPPMGISKLTRLQRDVSDLGLIKEQEPQYDDIVDRLTPDDKEYLGILLKSLPPEKEAKYREKALKEAKEGEDVYRQFIKIVVMNEFGPLRLSKYVS